MLSGEHSWTRASREFAEITDVNRPLCVALGPNLDWFFGYQSINGQQEWIRRREKGSDLKHGHFHKSCLFPSFIPFSIIISTYAFYNANLLLREYLILSLRVRKTSSIRQFRILAETARLKTFGYVANKSIPGAQRQLFRHVTLGRRNLGFDTCTPRGTLRPQSACSYADLRCTRGQRDMVRSLAGW